MAHFLVVHHVHSWLLHAGVNSRRGLSCQLDLQLLSLNLPGRKPTLMHSRVFGSLDSTAY